MISPFELKTYEEYEKEYLATGRLYSGKVFKIPNRPLNEKQLRTAYKNHMRKLERTSQKNENGREESLDAAVRNKCFERDRGCCQIAALFTGTEFLRFKEANNGLEAKLDAAHIFGKKAFPRMRYLEANVVMVNRASHNWLDACKSPVDGKPITAEERATWWKRAVGTERYNVLEALSMIKNEGGE